MLQLTNHNVLAALPKIDGVLVRVTKNKRFVIVIRHIEGFVGENLGISGVGNAIGSRDFEQWFVVWIVRVMHLLTQSVRVSSHRRDVRGWQVRDVFLLEFFGQGKELCDEELDQAYVEKVAIKIA